MSSVFNMAERWSTLHGGSPIDRPELGWEDRRLLWAVREPFISRHSSAEMVGGVLNSDDELVIGSQMPGDGVIDLAAEIKLLREIGYEGTVSLELFNASLWEQDPAEVLRVGRERLGDLFGV